MTEVSESTDATHEPVGTNTTKSMKIEGKLNRFIAVSLALFIVLAVGMSAAAIPRAGIGWDSGIDTQAALEVRDITPGTGLYDAYDQVFYTSEFYGVLIQWSADTIYRVSGGQGPLPTSSPITYQLQAVVNLFLIVFSSGLASAVVSLLLRCGIAGLYVWATALSLPLLMGQSLLNFKDLPTASGILLVSSGAALLWHSARPRVLAAVALLVFAGTFIALGVRIGSWILVGILLTLSIGLNLLISWRIRGLKTLALTIAAPAAGVVMGTLALYLLHPIARIDVARWAWDAYLVSRSYPWVGSIRVFGQDVMSTDLPWWYIPGWLLAQMPILVIGVGIAGVAYWLWRFVVALVAAVKTRGLDVDQVSFGLTPFAVQGLVLPAGLVVVGATMYDGIRHVTFAIPALIVLTAPLVAAILKAKDRRPGSRKTLPIAVALLVICVPLFSLIGSARWFPYIYAHVNVIAASQDDGRDWEYDYWGATIQEGVSRLRLLGLDPIVVTPTVSPLGNLEVAGAVSADAVSSDGEFGIYVFRRWYAQVPRVGCRTVFEIARGGVVLGEGAVCEGSESLEQLKQSVLEPRPLD